MIPLHYVRRWQEVDFVAVIAFKANVLTISDEFRHSDAFPILRKNRAGLYLGEFKKVFESVAIIAC